MAQDKNNEWKDKNENGIFELVLEKRSKTISEQKEVQKLYHKRKSMNYLEKMDGI